MAVKNLHGLRGSVLEEMINNTNDVYIQNNLCIVQKIPTPITPVKRNKNTITLAFFEKKSTVDYIGIVQGVGIAFDAKECQADRFPLANIHEHQLDFMEKVEEQQGIAFLIIYFSHINRLYYVPFKKIKELYERSKSGIRGTKSFHYNELDEDYLLKPKGGLLVPYLKGVQKDLQSR